MLKKIVLRNFQCHRKLVVTFDSNVTTIVGRSDAGKSAVVRALRWVLLNRPTGTGLVRRGAAKGRVTLTVGDHVISRRRGKSQNTYKLDGTEYKAFGNEVPAPIAEVLRVSEDNIQKQHDAPYWLSFSTGELSRTLNEVVDLQAIDRTLRNLNRTLRDARVSVEVSERRLSELRQRKTDLVFVRDADAEWAEIERMQVVVESARDRVERLRGLCEAGRGLQHTVGVVSVSAGELLAVIRKAGPVAEQVKKTGGKVARLRSLVAKGERSDTALRELNKSIRRVEKQLAEYKTCPLCGAKR